MKTTKSHRLLSALLAILMVFAICPMIALSASEATSSPATQAIDHWDGTVPGDLNGMTIPEFIMSGETYTVSYAEFSAHLEEPINESSVEKAVASANDDPYTDVVVKDEIGFAMLVLLTNCPYVITDKPANPICEQVPTKYILCVPATSDGSARNALSNFNYRNIFLGKDLYLNAPGEHTNQVAPLFWKRISATDTGWHMNIFNGQNHFISGWYMDATLSDNAYASIGFVGATANAGFNTSNLALLDMKMDIATASGFTATAVIGGIVGGGNIRKGTGAAVTVQNCYVDLDVIFTTHGTSATAAPGDYTVNGTKIKADIGGLVGELVRTPGATADEVSGGHTSSEIIKANLSNNVVDLEYTLNRPWARVSGLTASALAPSFQTDEGTGGQIPTTVMTVQNNVITRVDALSNTAQEETGFMAFTDIPLSLITNNWTVGEMDPAFTDASSTNKTVSETDMKRDTYWEANVATFGGAIQKPADIAPIPSVFASNTALLSALQVSSSDDFESNLTEGHVTFISSADELVKYVRLANELDCPARIRLTANIDMKNHHMPVIENLRLLDGQGHIISNYKNTVVYTTIKDVVEGKTGGFCETLSGTIQDVAFTNYYVTFDALVGSAEYFVGGLYGKHGGGALLLSNVYMEGYLAVTGTYTGNTRLGYFGASCYNYDGNVGVTIENSIFTGQVKGAAGNYFAADFGEADNNAANNVWNAILSYNDGTNPQTIVKPERQIKINNCYAIPYTVTNGEVALTHHVGNNVGLHSVALRNCYQSNLAKNAHLNHGGSIGYTNVVDGNGASLAYLDIFNYSANGTGSGTGGAFTFADFRGVQGTNKMNFTNNDDWNWYADGTPIPKVFGDNASALSIKTLAARDTVTNDYSVSLIGGQLRIDRAGMRFVATFDTSFSSSYYTIEYGFLILPKRVVDAERDLLYTDPLTQRVCTTDLSQMHASGSQKALDNAGAMPDNYSALFGIFAGIPDEILASNEYFQVKPYIAFLSPEDIAHNDAIEDPSVQRSVSYILYAENAQQFSGVLLANAYCASPYIWNVYKLQIYNRFKDVADFKYTLDSNDNVVLKEQ